MQRKTYLCEQSAMQHHLGQKEKSIGVKRKELALIKNLIYPKVKRGMWGMLCVINQSRSKL